MRIALSTARKAHYRLPANSFARRGHSVTIYSSTPGSRLSGFDPLLQKRFVPAPVTLFNAITRVPTPVLLNELDSALYDELVSRRIGEYELFLGAASSSLSTGKRVQRSGGVFVLDRACPDIRVQQDMLADEARKAGGHFRRHAPWFLQRQVDEYEQADFLLMPSNYTRSSYPEHIKRKAIIAPLTGRTGFQSQQPKPPDSPFVVGVVGGEPLRKGYLYLLEAWKQLKLPNARLKIRSGSNFRSYSVLASLLSEQPDVSIVPYVPDLRAFYAECDVFILPSIDDGFGMALFEAMACSVPSIATRNTGASEHLTDGKDGLVIDAFSTVQIADALLRLYESPDLRASLGAAGQQTVRRLTDGDSVKMYEIGIDALLSRVAGRKEASASSAAVNGSF